MDKKAANNLIVGAIVAGGFVTFVFILFNIGGGTGFLTSQYRLFGRFKDVKGLHTGSEVSLSGLRVGVIDSIKVTDDGSKDLIVEFSVLKSVRERIREDSLATIRTQGVLGDKYIALSIGSANFQVLQSGAFIKTAEAEDLFSKGGQVVNDISRYFEEGGSLNTLIKRLDQLAENLNGLAVDVKRQKGVLNTMIYGDSGAKLSKSLEHLEGILGKIDRGEGSLGALINDPTVYEDIKSLFGGAKRSNILKYFIRQFSEEGKEKPVK